MPNIPLVSVVLPVYNRENYLQACIESVLKQSYENFELIIWNDGSTHPAMLAILDQFTDPRVKRYNAAINRGLFPSLNSAINVATGSLIHIWASDDLMKPTCLAAEVAFHQLHPEIGMSYCAADIIDTSGAVIYPPPPDATPEIVSPALATQIMFYHGSMPGNIANVMIKASTFERVGLFREDMRVTGDLEMWVRIAGQYPIGFIKKAQVCLRAHSEQLSQHSDSIVYFMQEEREIFQTLYARLPDALKSHAAQYQRWRRNVLNTRYLLRYLFRRQFRTAWKVYQALRVEEYGFLLFARWLLTLDGRWQLYRPQYIQDEP